MATPKSAAEGSVYWAQNLGNVLMGNLVGPGLPYTWPEIQAFSDWLNQLTSPDATARMTAAGPQIADITAQAQGYQKSIANLPPGGQKAYLEAQGEQNKSTQIANLLTSEFAQAEAQKGQLGQWAVGETLQGMGEAANIELGAGQLGAELAYINAQGNQGFLDTLGSLSKILGPALLAAFPPAGAAAGAASIIGGADVAGEAGTAAALGMAI